MINITARIYFQEGRPAILPIIIILSQHFIILIVLYVYIYLFFHDRIREVELNIRESFIAVKININNLRT